MGSLLLSGLLVAALSPEPTGCAAKLGEWFDKQCRTVEIEGMTLTFTGTTRPYPQVAMSCWNYEVTRGASNASFRQCHTGVLGGTAEFTLEDRAFVVDLDVPWCGQRVDRLGMVVHDKTRVRDRYDERVAQRAKVHPCEPAAHE